MPKISRRKYHGSRSRTKRGGITLALSRAWLRSYNWMLFYACAVGDYRKIQEALVAGADPNWVFSYDKAKPYTVGGTMLGVAAEAWMAMMATFVGFSSYQGAPKLEKTDMEGVAEIIIPGTSRSHIPVVTGDTPLFVLLRHLEHTLPKWPRLGTSASSTLAITGMLPSARSAILALVNKGATGFTPEGTYTNILGKSICNQEKLLIQLDMAGVSRTAVCGSRVGDVSWVLGGGAGLDDVAMGTGHVSLGGDDFYDAMEVTPQGRPPMNYTPAGESVMLNPSLREQISAFRGGKRRRRKRTRHIKKRRRKRRRRTRRRRKRQRC